MNTILLEFDIGTTNPDAALGVRVLIDNTIVYDNPHVTTPYHFSHDIDDQDGEHELCIELYGKLNKHTVVNQACEITQDSLLTVGNLQIDSIELGNIMQERMEYHHDFNGTQEPIVDKFYGAMGCNGQLKLTFTTPIYLWLLENM